MSSTFNGDETASFFGFLGAAAALVFSCMGVACGMAKSGVRVASMGVMRSELVMKSIVPVVMAGVLAGLSAGMAIGIVGDAGVRRALLNTCRQYLLLCLSSEAKMYTDYTVDGSDLFLQPLLGIRRVIQLEGFIKQQGSEWTSSTRDRKSEEFSKPERNYQSWKKYLVPKTSFEFYQLWLKT